MTIFSKTSKATKPIIIAVLFVALLTFLIIYDLSNLDKSKKAVLHSSLKEVQWLVGTWENLESGARALEVWTVSNSTRLEGDGYLIQKNDTSFHEDLTIESLNGQVIYIAQFSGQSPTLFHMINSEANYLVFENKEHIYPQKISYNLINDSAMVTRLEGKNEFGEVVNRTFRYIRKK